MKKIALLAMLALAPVLAAADSSTNVSFSISPPPVGFVDPYFEDHSNTKNSAAINLEYMGISSSSFNLNNFTLNYSESMLKAGPGILYANAGGFYGAGNINMGAGWSDIPLTSFGMLLGMDYVARIYSTDGFKIFLAPGIDGNLSMMTFTMDNYPEYFDYVNLVMVYGSVTGDSMIIGLTPKISLQANWKPINELELIPFVTFSVNMTDTETFVYTSDTEQDLAYTSINFGLEAVFFDSFLLSSMVQFLNNGSDTKIITINLSIPVK